MHTKIRTQCSEEEQLHHLLLKVFLVWSFMRVSLFNSDMEEPFKNISPFRSKCCPHTEELLSLGRDGKPHFLRKEYPGYSFNSVLNSLGNFKESLDLFGHRNLICKEKLIGQSGSSFDFLPS